MLLWILLIGGFVLILTIGMSLHAMWRAERRARRSLYRSLGLAETTVDFLMERNRDVLAELDYVRGEGEAAVAEARARTTPARSGRPALRLVQSESPALQDESEPKSGDNDGDPANEIRH